MKGSLAASATAEGGTADTGVAGMEAGAGTGEAMATGTAVIGGAEFGLVFRRFTTPTPLIMAIRVITAATITATATSRKEKYPATPWERR